MKGSNTPLRNAEVRYNYLAEFRLFTCPFRCSWWVKMVSISYGNRNETCYIKSSFNVRALTYLQNVTLLSDDTVAVKMLI